MLDLGPRAVGDPFAARAVDQLRVGALFRRHREDDRLDPVELALVDVGVLQLLHRPHPRHHPEQAAERAHLAHLAHLLEEVLERELVRFQLLLEVERLLLVDLLLGLLDQAEHVAHAEDARGHAVGVEALEGLELLAGRGEEDRLAGHRLDRERGAAAGVAVELGHHDAVELGRLGEGLGDADRVLAGHRVDDEQHVVGLDPLADLRQLLHQVLVDVEAAGGVDDQHVAALLAGLVERPAGDLDRVGVGAFLVDVGAGTAADRDQLVDRGGPVDVAGGEGDVLLAVLAQVAGELGAGGRLARALQAGHQDHGRAARRRRRARARCRPSARSAPR